MINYKHLHYFLIAAKTGSITRAAERLHLTPQTLSGQITQFEKRFEAKLFQRAGRRIELTDTGKQILGYAEEIFQIGGELENVLKSGISAHAAHFRAGIADPLPKNMAYQLLAPVLGLPEPVRLICREDNLENLVAELALHRLDLVLADRPMPPGVDIRGYSHPLGECNIGFFATPEVAARLSGEFPACLKEAPILIPSEESALRIPLVRWLERHCGTPDIIGEFDDSALMLAFGRGGVGVFPLPLAGRGVDEVTEGLVCVGVSQDVRARFFAITAERRLRHPAVVAMWQNARQIMPG